VPVFFLGRKIAFPDPRHAEPDGLLAVGGDLSAGRLLEAYRRGIFPWPWAEDQPLTWYSPPLRCVFEPGRFRANRSFRRTLRSGRFECRINTHFDDIILACAQIKRPGQSGTWITDDIISAYRRLHRMGHAHSVETWYHGQLAGGLYGLALGGAFFAESMFHREADASKFAIHSLSEILLARGFAMIDAQVPSKFLLALGATTLTRTNFLTRLRDALALDCHFP